MPKLRHACKIAVYFQKTFFYKHLWVDASLGSYSPFTITKTKFNIYTTFLNINPLKLNYHVNNETINKQK